MKYFRTDGIRGEAYKELTLEIANLVGQFYKTSSKKVVIGMDTRASSPDIVEAIYNGLNGHSDVVVAGVIPTGGLMYYTYVNSCIGIMVTASHNPYKDNGIKVIDNGVKIDLKEREAIEEFINKHNNFTYQLTKPYTYEVDDEVNDLYLEFLESLMIPHKLKVIYDGANGACSYILKELFSPEEVINCEPNGKNINLNCGSTNVSSLIQKLKIRKADIGIAFDGDGDRMIVVDKYNRIYEGDFLTYLFAVDLHERKMLKGNTVVFTEVSNPAIINKLNEIGIHTMITEVGDHHISKALDREYVLGGEASGHIINKTLIPFGDGLANAMELLKFLSTSPKKIHEYSYELKLYHTKTVNISSEGINITEKLREKVEKYARKKKITVILRVSGTEKVIRLFIYQPKINGMNKNIDKVLKMIRNAR